MTVRRAAAALLLLAAMATQEARARPFPKLTDLLDYFTVKVGPAEPGHLPPGLVCKISHSGRCHCDSYADPPGVQIGGIGGPSKRCGLAEYSMDEFPEEIGGRKPIAAREYVFTPRQIVRRYGQPTYATGTSRDWNSLVFCTDLNGRLLKSTELNSIAEFYQFTFGFSGHHLWELDVQWTDRCDPERSGHRPIP